LFYLAGLRQGISVFDKFIVIAEPGSVNVKVIASCKAINSAKINGIFGNPLSNNTISIDFRNCKPGEQLTGSSWRKCSPGTYSLEWNSPKCLTCLDNAVWEGGAVININSGFWRKSSNSTTIIEWVNK